MVFSSSSLFCSDSPSGTLDASPGVGWSLTGSMDSMSVIGRTGGVLLSSFLSSDNGEQMFQFGLC